MGLYVSAYRVLILRLYDGETLDEWDQSVLVTTVRHWTNGTKLYFCLRAASA